MPTRFAGRADSLGHNGRQQTLVGTLENIAQTSRRKRDFAAPAVAVFGEVVSLREKLNWFEDRPLSRQTHRGYPNSKASGRVDASNCVHLGADVIELPTIRIEPPTDLRAFAELVQDAHAYDWIVFTSPNGVTAFFDLFFKLYDDAREIGGARIAAIGPATAQRIKDFHLTSICSRRNLWPNRLCANSERKAAWKTCAILLARAEKARDVLPKELLGFGSYCGRGFCLPHGSRNARRCTGARAGYWRRARI